MSSSHSRPDVAHSQVKGSARVGTFSRLCRSGRESLKVLGTVGEPINPEAWQWYYTVVGEKRCPIVDTFWQTETVRPRPRLVAPLLRTSCRAAPCWRETS